MSDLTFGLWITAAGMGVVFGLLILLWGLLALSSLLDRKPEESEAGEEEVALQVTPLEPAEPGLADEDLAAITVAVITHRTLRRLQAAPEMRSVVPGSQIWASRWLGAGRTRQTRGWQGRR